MARSTEDWSGYTANIVDGKWQAQRKWIVVQVQRKRLTDALRAVPELGEDRVAREGDEHPENKLMTCSGLVPRYLGPAVAEVVATYTMAAGGNGSANGDSAAALLSRATTVTPGRGSYSLPVDRDLNGNPIVNSAGDAFDPPPTRDFPIDFLTARRWEPFWDTSKCRKYRNKLNSKAMRLGKSVLLAGEVLLRYYGPAAVELQLEGVSAVLMEYEFEIRWGEETTVGKGIRKTAKSLRPFDITLKDAGRRAWFNVGGKKQLGELYRKDDNALPVQITSDVPFDGYGLPIDKTLVGRDGVSKPVKPAKPFVPKSYISPISTPELAQLIFPRIDEVDLNDLKL